MTTTWEIGRRSYERCGARVAEGYIERWSGDGVQVGQRHRTGRLLGASGAALAGKWRGAR